MADERLEYSITEAHKLGSSIVVSVLWTKITGEDDDEKRDVVLSDQLGFGLETTEKEIRDAIDARVDEVAAVYLTEQPQDLKGLVGQTQSVTRKEIDRRRDERKRGGRA